MFKFLDPAGCTYYHHNKAFAYNLPRANQKYAGTQHPKPSDPDGYPCGPGRLHLMKSLNAKYAPVPWWPWWAVGVGLIGEDDEKAAYAAVRLRRIRRDVFWRALRPPFNWGSGANLRLADLYGADLRKASYNDYTIWPANFEADKSGAVLSAD